MIAARDAEDAEALLGVSIVSSATDKISDAAAHIAKIVLKKIGIHPIVREVFEKVEEHLGRATVRENSILVNKTLEELDFAARIGIDVIALRRGKEWIIDPKDNRKIKEKDILIARGAEKGIEELIKLSKGTSKLLKD
jgi:uncharacterized protein with PhoU and TrkA domain